MSMFIPPAEAFGAPSPGPAVPATQQTRENDYAGSFSSVFLQGMLKEIFKNQWKNGMLDDNISNSLYAEMLTEEMIKQLAENDAFGLNDLVKESIAKSVRMQAQQQEEL